MHLNNEIRRHKNCLLLLSVIALCWFISYGLCNNRSKILLVKQTDCENRGLETAVHILENLKNKTKSQENKVEIENCINVLKSMLQCQGKSYKEPLKVSINKTKVINRSEIKEEGTMANIIPKKSSTSEIKEKRTKADIIPKNSSTDQVCPEIYKNKHFILDPQCAADNSRRISKLVTFVLNFQTYADDQLHFINRIVLGIRKLYHDINIIAAVSSSFRDAERMKNLNRIYVTDEDKPGAIWNDMIQKVTTPYVFIGRDLVDFNSDTVLERFIGGMFSLKLNITGGAVRTESNGHWSHGCYQTAYKNYTLAYKLGYHHSAHDCLYCHFILGSFIAKTDFMKENKFDENLPESVLFHDYFIDLFKKKMDVGVCPDNMLHVRDEATKNINREEWLSLIKKRHLLKVKTPDDTTFTFTCREAYVKNGIRKKFINPPCFTQDMADHVKFVMRKCAEHKIYCELADGTLLSAVKLSRLSLWEQDADTAHPRSKTSAIGNLREEFRQGGYRLKALNREPPYKSHGPGLRVDLFTIPERTPVEMQNPTKVLFHGEWMNVPWNVGRYVRDLFGPEVYKHKQHWTHLPKHLRKNVTLDRFTPCPNPTEHDCLDNFQTDGSLQFDYILP